MKLYLLLCLCTVVIMCQAKLPDYNQPSMYLRDFPQSRKTFGYGGLGGGIGASAGIGAGISAGIGAGIGGGIGGYGYGGAGGYGGFPYYG